MNRLLITGGAGFIGANFVHWCRRHRPERRLVVLDALTYAGNLASLDAVRDGIRFVQGDVCDAALVEGLLAEERIDCVVHFAAESHVDRSIVAPDEFIRTNVLGTHTLLKAARSAWREGSGYRDGVRFHHVSTDEVYGTLGSTDPAFTEHTPYAPNSPYAASKAGSDHLVRAYHHTYALPVTVSNCSNNYGPFQFPEKLIPLMIVNALDGRPLPVYGKGENVRDWLYVEDHCAAVDLILERGTVGRVYNVGGRNERRNIEVVQTICESLNRRFAADPSLAARFPNCPAVGGADLRGLMRFVTDRLGHDWRYAIDATRLEGELGFRPVHRFETGIEDTLSWYLANEAWWRGLLQRAAVAA